MCFSSYLRGTTKYLEFCNRYILVNILHGIDIPLSPYAHNTREILQVLGTKMNRNSTST